MKTAVEWLEIQLFKKQGKFNKSDIKQAKAMEKEQIKDAYWNGTYNISKKEALETAEHFYNETYKR